MKHDLMIEALKRRRGKSLHKTAQKGIDSPDLEEKTELDLGAGIREENLKDSRHHQKHSTDDLSPSNEELEMKTGGDKMPSLSDSGGNIGGYDDDIFDEDEYEKLKRRGGKKSLLDRVYENIAKKRGM